VRIPLVNRVNQITEEIKQLEANLNLLIKELNQIQKNCKHDFQNESYIQKCKKCYLIESLYW